jgi:Ser/Thr protein kinase RdoA (MazF antagonist)
MSDLNTPYSTLTPDLILEAVESLGLRCSGSLLALNSYENRVYQVGIEDEKPVIAKFYRPNRWSTEAINEEHEFAHELLHHEIPVVAPLLLEDKTLHEHGGFRFALFPRRGGRTLELDNMDQLEWMGRFIGRLHAIGACQPFQHRIQLNAQTYGYVPYQFLIQNNFIPAEIRFNYSQAVEAILQHIEQIFEEVGEVGLLRLHGDCHAGNVLWNTEGPHIVDLDDCLTGPAIQDIWMLLSGNQQDVKAQLAHILDGYEEFNDFNVRELKLVEALRSLRMMHYSAWLAKRWEDPTFPLNFPWFNTPRYWQQHLQDLREQLELLKEQSHSS